MWMWVEWLDFKLDVLKLWEDYEYDAKCCKTCFKNNQWLES